MIERTGIFQILAVFACFTLGGSAIALTELLGIDEIGYAVQAGLILAVGAWVAVAAVRRRTLVRLFQGALESNDRAVRTLTFREVSRSFGFGGYLKADEDSLEIFDSETGQKTIGWRDVLSISLSPAPVAVGGRRRLSIRYVEADGLERLAQVERLNSGFVTEAESRGLDEITKACALYLLPHESV